MSSQLLSLCSSPGRRLPNQEIGSDLKLKITDLLKDPLLIKKYSNPLSYFKSYNANDTPHTEERYKKFFGVYEQTTSSQESLKQIAEQLDLDQKHLFELIECAISEEPVSMLVKICKKPYNEELANTISRLVRPLYVQEQVDIYKLISTFISIRQFPKHAAYQQVVDFLENKIKPQDLLKHIWEDFKKLANLQPTKFFKNEPGLFFMTKHKQQFWILMILFKGISTNYFVVDPDMYEQIFKLFSDQDLMGSFQKDIETGVRMEQGIEEVCRTNLVLSLLVLIAGLYLEELYHPNREAAINRQGRAFKVLTEKGDMIINALNQKRPELQIEMGIYITAVISGLNMLLFLVTNVGRDTQLSNKLKQIMQKIGDLPYDEYAHSMDNILQNDTYTTYMIQSEKEMVKTCLRSVMILVLVGSKDEVGAAYCEALPEQTCTFLTRAVASITDSPHDLELFWSDFDPNDNKKCDLSLIFSNLLQIFPFRGYLTLEMAEKLIGESSFSFARPVLKVFATLRSAYIEVQPDVQAAIRQTDTQRMLGNNSVNDDLVVCELMRPTYIPELEATFKAGTLLEAYKTRESNENRYRILARTNYWNVFWRSITKFINDQQSDQKDMVSLLNQRTLSLICKMITQDVLNAAIIEQLCLAGPDKIEQLESDYFYQPDSISCSALIMMLVQVQEVLVQGGSNSIALVLDITRALNSLISGVTCKQVITVIHILYGATEQDEESPNTNVFKSIIELISEKQYEEAPESAQLLNEVVIMIETFVLRSEYIFDYFPSTEYINMKADVQVSQTRGMIQQIRQVLSSARAHHSESWEEGASKNMSDKICELSHTFNPGTVMTPSEFIFELLYYPFVQAIQIVTKKTTINFYNFTELEFLIQARILSIINNLMSRFRSNRGKQMVTEMFTRPDDSNSLVLIAEFLKRLNVQELIMHPFITEIRPEIYLGSDRGSQEANELGIENGHYLHKVPFSKDQAKAAETLQTYLIEGFNCFNTLSSLVGDYLTDNSSPAAILQVVRDSAEKITSPELFFGREFNDYRDEYSISFVVAFLMLAKFNREKGMPLQETIKLHDHHFRIIADLEESLFFLDNANDARIDFTSKINQSLIYTSGRLGQILRCRSISTSALNSLYEVMRLWRKNKSINKPVLGDLLASGKVSTHFATEILNWTHQLFVDNLAPLSAQGSPQTAHKTLLILGEAMVSQQGYFNDFMKYCDSLKSRSPSMNEFIYLLRTLIKDLKDKPSIELFEKSDNFDCMCQVVQLVSNLYLRPNVKLQYQSDVKKFLIKELSELILKVVKDRSFFTATIIPVIISSLVNKDGAMYTFEVPDIAKTIELIRFRNILEQESKFNYAICLFMKVLNGELLDHRNLEKVNTSTTSTSSAGTGVNPTIFLELVKYLLDFKKLRLYNIIALVDSTLKNKLLLNEDDDLSLQSDQNKIQFKREERWDPQNYKDAFFDESWGNTYDDYQVTVAIRELKHSVPYSNTTLHYISLYNQLYKLQLYHQMSVQEVNSNLSIVTGNGLNGMMFSTTLHPNPSYNPSMAVANLVKMMNRNNQVPEVFSFGCVDLIDTAKRMREQDIGPSERKLFNPLFEYRHQEWLGNMYGISDQNYSEAGAFCNLCEKITGEIRQLAHLVLDARKEFNTELETHDSVSILVNMVCTVAFNHLTSLAHLIVNSYFEVADSLHNAEDMSEFQSIIPNTIRIITKFIGAINTRSSWDTEDTQGTDAIVQANYYSLFILSQFDQEVVGHSTGHDFKQLATSLSQKFRLEGPSQDILIQSYLLLVKIQPGFFNAADADLLAGLLLQESISPDIYKVVCMFLIECFDSTALKQNLSSIRLLNILCSNRRFLDNMAFDNFIYYEGEVLSPELSLWLWTLATVVHCFEAFKRTSVGALDALVGFVKLYQSRFLSIIGFQFTTLNGQAQNLAGAHSEKVRNECFRSTAYLQELELVLSLLSVLFSEYAFGDLVLESGRKTTKGCSTTSHISC